MILDHRFELINYDFIRLKLFIIVNQGNQVNHSTDNF